MCKPEDSSLVPRPFPPPVVFAYSMRSKTGGGNGLGTRLGGQPIRPKRIFFWTRFENLAAKRRKINDRVVPILVAIRNWNDVIWLSRSEKVAEFAQCVAP